MNTATERRRHARSEGLLAVIENITYETLRSHEDEMPNQSTAVSFAPLPMESHSSI